MRGLLLLALLGTIDAFSLSPTHRNGYATTSHLGSTRIPSNSLVSKPKSVRIRLSHDKKEPHHRLSDLNRLELGDDGCLRVDQRLTLLDGLSPRLWTSESSTNGGDGGSSSLFLRSVHSKKGAQHELTLGNLVTCRRLLACARLTRYWMGPAFGTSAADIPLDTQFMLVELEQDGPYALFLPLVDAGFRASLEYSAKDTKVEMVCYSESGDPCTTSSGMRALYVRVGDDPFTLLREGFRQVADTTGTFRTLSEKNIPNSVNDFGWCTWDAFYSAVHPQGILNGVKSLVDLGVPPRNLILDDGWQNVTPRPPDWADTHNQENSGGHFLSPLSDAAFSLLARMVTHFYEHRVKKSEHGSFPNKVWTVLAKTVLKDGLRRHFDSTSDFGRQLSTFQPNVKFQSGGDHLALSALVDRLKGDLGVKRVYCWHAIHGYWRGVTSELGQEIGINVTQVHTQPTDHLLRVEPQMAFDTPSLFGVGMITNEPDLETFYQHLHEPLVQAGVDGVKVDVQSGVSAAGSGVGGGPHIARIYTEAMENSVAKRFSSKDGAGAIECINCMAHSTENLYRYKVTAVARASDDFYPSRSESHTVHLINVAYNSIFIGEICLPDFDMFQSAHPSAQLHAAARAVGGCPVYVSDVPGDHDAELLKKLILPDGSILRAQLPGRPTRDSLFTDVGKDGLHALKVWNQNKGGGGVVGAFNAQGVAWNFKTNENEVLNSDPPTVVAEVRPCDVEPFKNIGGPFVVWRHKMQSFDIVPESKSSIRIPLSSREWEIATIVPIDRCGDVAWAPIGLANMLNSGGAVLQVSPVDMHTSPKRNKNQPVKATITARGPGQFVAYCRPAPVAVIVNSCSAGTHSEIPFTFEEESGLLGFVLGKDQGESRAHQVTVLWEDTGSW